VEAPRGVKLTGTNRSIGLTIALVRCRLAGGESGHRSGDARVTARPSSTSIRLSDIVPAIAGAHSILGGYGGGGTPVPIPNTEVKPSCGDGTACKSVGE
jgi:hypothetical protein